MQLHTILTILAFGTSALGLANPQAGYGRPSTCSTTTTLSTTTTRTLLRRPTTTVTDTKSITVSTTCKPDSTVTTTATTTDFPSTCPTSCTTCDPATTVTTTWVRTSTVTPTTSPPEPSTVTTTLVRTSIETQNQTIISTTTQVLTVATTQLSTTTTTETATSTATPGPVVELVAFRRASCGVQPVATNGNSPNFQTIQLSYDATRRQSQCVRIGQQSPQSFWWDTVSFAPIPSGCHLYFYSGDSCFDDGPGGQQISLNNGRGSCRNLNGIAQSVQLFC